MTTTATDSPPTSEPRFFTASGAHLSGPTEWKPCLIEIPCDVTAWSDVAVRINGRTAAVSARTVGGRNCVVADWVRAGPGWYELHVQHGVESTTHRIRVGPSKISDEAFRELLTDLESRLPVTLAIALRDAGARIGFDLVAPAQQTLASEVARVRRAVHGARRPGLLSVLNALADDPHRMLTNIGMWVKRQHVRRPDPAGLIQAMWKAGNIEHAQPKQVLDRRVEHTVDLYENRLLKAFVDEVGTRLRRLDAILGETTHAEVADEVRDMLQDLSAARRRAAFLDDVGRLQTAPNRVTMVLLRRREYRAAYEGFLEFRRRLSVHLDEPALSEPLRNLPDLYQMWGSLVVLEAVVDAAKKTEFDVRSQRLVWPRAGGLYLSVLHDNKPALELRRNNGDQLRVYPERSYRAGGSPLASVSFTQRPDIALELIRPGGTVEVVILDPKYKLESEDIEPGDGSPKKVDIDKMHAYRDAIRDTAGRHVVRYAATLYPGATTEYGNDVAALRAYPSEASSLQARVAAIIRPWLEETNGQV